MKKVRLHYKAICDIVDDKVSAKLIAKQMFEGMVKRDLSLPKIDDKIRGWKIPINSGMG